MPGSEGAEMSKCRACPQEAQGWEWGEGIKASQQSQCRAMSAVMQEAQDTVGIPKGQETSKLCPIGGARVAGQRGGEPVIPRQKAESLPSRGHIILESASILKGWERLFPIVEAGLCWRLRPLGAGGELAFSRVCF